MKNILIRIAFLIALFNCYMATAQFQNVHLTGIWTLNYNLTSAAMQADVKKAFKSLSLTNRSLIEKSYQGRQMIFMPNNVFELKLSDGRSSTGGWTSNPEENILIIKNEKTNKEYRYKIVELTDQMVVIEELDLQGKGYFKKLYFIKSKN